MSVISSSILKYFNTHQIPSVTEDVPPLAIDASARIQSPVPEPMPDTASLSSGSSGSSIHSQEASAGEKRKRAEKEVEGLEVTDSDGEDETTDQTSEGDGVEQGTAEVERRSGKNSKKIRDGYRDRTLVIDVKGPSYQAYVKKIKAIDKHALFGTEYDELFRPICSKCQSVAPYKEPYDSTRFRKHYTIDCSGKPRNTKKPKTGPNVFLAMFPGFSSKKSAPPRPSLPMSRVPCPGITANDDDRIPNYLQRCPSGGGGGRAVVKIAMEKFKVLFSKLKGERREEVLMAQEHEWKWRNNHTRQRVFSVSCAKAVTSPEKGKRPQPCKLCDQVLRSKSFRNALRKEGAKPETMKHTNYRFRPNETLAKLYAKYRGLDKIFDAVSLCRQSSDHQRPHIHFSLPQLHVSKSQSYISTAKWMKRVYLTGSWR